MAVCLSDSPPSQGPCCPVCYRDYSDSDQQLIPRILQCGHTYCSECLDKLLNMEPDEDDFQEIVLNIRYAGREWTTARNYPRSRYSTNELKCPTCKSVNPVHNKDVSTLTKNFALLGCIQPPATQRNKHFCKDHNHEKRIYCCDCRILICAYCQLYGGHTGHKYEVATEAAKPSVDGLKQVDSGISRDLNRLDEGKGKVLKTVKKFDRRKERSVKKVKRYFESSIAKLREEMKLTLERVDKWSSEQRFVLTAQLDMMSKYSQDLRSLQSECQSLVLGDPLDALTRRQGVEERVQRVQSQVSSISLKPLIQPWMKVTVQDREASDTSLKSIVENCQLTYDTDSESRKKKKAEDGAQKYGSAMPGAEGATAMDEVSNQMDGSESSFDSCSDEMDSLSNGRQPGSGLLMNTLPNLPPPPPPQTSNSESCQIRLPPAIFSQETHSQLDGGATPRVQGFSFDPEYPHLFNLGARRGEVIIHTPSASGESDSAPSEGEQAPSYSLGSARPTSYQLLMEAAASSGLESNVQLMNPFFAGMNNQSTDESDQEDHTHQHHRNSHTHLQQLHTRQSPTGFGGGGAIGMTLDPLRRHWDFLNDHLGGAGDDEDGAVGGGSSAKEEEEDDDDANEEEEIAMTLHSLMYEPSARSAPPSEGSSPSPRSFLNSSGNDFAFAHHITLPGVNGEASSHEDEVVFPNPPFFSWARSNPLQQFNHLYNNDNSDED